MERNKPMSPGHIIFVVAIATLSIATPTISFADPSPFSVYRVPADKDQPAVRVARGFTPFEDKVRAPCFDPKPNPAPFTQNSSFRSVDLYVVEQSNLKEVDETKEWSGGLEGSAELKIYDGSSKFSGSIKNTVASKLSNTSVVLVMDVELPTGFRDPALELNLNGIGQLKAGRNQFLHARGFFFGVREELAIRFYIVFIIHLSNASYKENLLQSLGYTGHFKAFGIGGGGQAASNFDKTIQTANGVSSVEFTVRGHAGQAVQGLGSLLSAASDFEKHPIASAMSAVGQFLKDRSADEGHIMSVNLVPVGDLVPDIPYSHLIARFAYTRILNKLLGLVDALSIIKDPNRHFDIIADDKSFASEGEVAVRRLLNWKQYSMCVRYENGGERTFFNAAVCET
jgi:hypothetical protein